jgi:hypothetical protein
MGNLWNKYSFVIVAIIGIISVSATLKARQVTLDLQKQQMEIENYKRIFGIKECKINLPPCSDFIVQYRYMIGDQKLTAILYKSDDQVPRKQRTCRLIVKKSGSGHWQYGIIESIPGGTMTKRFCDITSFPMMTPDQQDLMLEGFPGMMTLTGFGAVRKGNFTTAGQSVDWEFEVVNADTKTMDKSIHVQH